jgi:HsdM N-terminal domain
MAQANANNESARPFEATLWAAADKLRGTLDAAEYKHVVLGLIFLKYISDAFEERRAELDRQSRDKNSDYYVKDVDQRERVLEDKDAYSEVNVFWVAASSANSSNWLQSGQRNRIDMGKPPRVRERAGFRRPRSKTTNWGADGASATLGAPQKDAHRKCECPTRALALLQGASKRSGEPGLSSRPRHATRR